MTNTSPTVVFFGSGPVAAASLERLITDSPFTIEAVVTKPNPPHHRGTAPVLELSERHNLTVHTPIDKAGLSQLVRPETFTSPVGIVIDYGIIINDDVINSFEHGIINSHFSLLPEWRGADPITFSLLSGQPETGVSLMSIVAAMDEGPLLAQEKLVIQSDDNSITLTEKLIQLSHSMLQKYLPEYLDGSRSLQQQTGTPTYSRKLTKADGIVDWSKPAAVIEREVRAYYSWPKSTATIGGHQVIVRKTVVSDTSDISKSPGEYTVTKKTLTVYCGDGALDLQIVQPLNKKEMPIAAFLAGYSR